MLQSKIFTKTLRDSPKDETSKNAQYLIRGGFVDKLMAGVYSYLPLGLRVLKRIENIIREEINAAGGQEIFMPAIHPIENYTTTGREAIDVLFHTETQTGHRIVLGQSHEEVIVPLVKKFIESYRDLPLAVYQIQTKFRNELRPKSGIFRGREFLMKDLYSFHADEDDFDRYYKTIQQVYKKIFDRAGIGSATVRTFASGGTFSKYSLEFQTITDAGEDTIFLCERCSVAVNDEVKDDCKNTCPECKKPLSHEPKKSIEVGNIFPLKTRFSDAFNLSYKDPDGKQKPVIMGCYGIGVTRLMGAIAEVHSDEHGIIWPESVAPFLVHILPLSKAAIPEAKRVELSLAEKSIPVLLDDREDKSAGEKFSDADLIGIPWRVVISDNTIKKEGIEVKKRSEREAKIMSVEEFLDQFL
ncbi:MAG: hypothetical protein A3F26_01495 [Candidatus Ryanbacteria bacterium RIFCSPHIGHO2_12_FULL_47_12b]|uniref:Proline--tRNA ligase n=3 Tax=Parcubacteria group TaxID=1794811 RepID=A0A1G2H5E8_9BACT|nr:MAG: Proline-tRNA ligase [Parcubacteria group bacterium GW2011_GWA2_47_10b]KKU75993.1 MAG: Proline-tRNA ligase [Candidatus Giovannonibacteria bacterium GW2011_GWB1_47_6b]KKU85947.1 MAG: Proline-tRNA ligase [Parcubacteria group bacterium GW2011_GWA1_47_9]OGZ47466.1 MAG: hypothetical protein A2844_00545 [Candidatus Ryanbacteria bacterium RIFCSPHIGHO2_01_FULL_48_80]OGZ49492.1 MAG: hypothetical protein A3C83_02325 [Candidatus Ryanbacteria bacterium RIFCSPHIGHO2_02_FULL_47_25]OGZ52343.1 MAG: hyp